MIDIKGKTFHRWTVLNYVGNQKWLCKCICGTEKIVPGVNIRHGISKSCGCYRDEKAKLDNTTHGLTNTYFYRKWANMHDVCYNTKNKRYKDWGGRGIKISDRWHKSNPKGFLNFHEDILSLGERPSLGHTIDRINNDGDYEPSNVRWGSKLDQRLNQRNYRIKYLEYKDIKHTQKEWSIILKINASKIVYWLKKGKDFSWIYEHFKKDLRGV